MWRAFYPPLIARRVERLKCLNMERERVMEQYLEERAALERKYSDLWKPIYEERGNVVAGCLDNEIERIHKEGGGKKEEERSKRDDGGGDAGEGEEMEGPKSMEDASNNNNKYVTISSRGTTNTNAKSAKDDDNEEGAHGVKNSVLGMRNRTHGGRSLINNGELRGLSRASHGRYLSKLWGRHQIRITFHFWYQDQRIIYGWIIDQEIWGT